MRPAALAALLALALAPATTAGLVDPVAESRAATVAGDGFTVRGVNQVDTWVVVAPDGSRQVWLPTSGVRRIDVAPGTPADGTWTVAFDYALFNGQGTLVWTLAGRSGSFPIPDGVPLVVAFNWADGRPIVMASGADTVTVSPDAAQDARFFHG